MSTTDSITSEVPQTAAAGPAPIALGPGEGEALWFLGTLGRSRRPPRRPPAALP